MPLEAGRIELSERELREIAGYATECARRALWSFEQRIPADPRPREAIDAAHAFAGGGPRTSAPRQSGWAAFRAGREAASPAAPPGGGRVREFISDLTRLSALEGEHDEC